MEFNWTVEYSLTIDNDELQEITDFTRAYMKQGVARDKAISLAVDGYLDGQDDSIYYSITEEVTKQIEAKVNELLTE